MDENKLSANFIYRPPIQSDAKALPATFGVKFAKGVHFLDPWGFMLIGMSRWQRIIFRLKHPIIYSKRWFWRFSRKIKSILQKEKVET